MFYWIWLYADLGFVGSDAVVSSEDGVALGVPSAQAEADTDPDREGSSSKKEDGCQNTTTQT